MSYNGSGTFSINSAGQPVITGTVISSTAFNALTADLATGLSTAITKDGQTTTTARILFAQGVSSTLVTDATSATTGSIITAGGISMQKALWVGTTATIAGATTMAGITATSLALGGATLGTNALAVTGTTLLNSALTYGGVTLSNAVTGTGSMVLSAGPTLTGTPTVYQGTAAAVAPLRFNTAQDASATTWAIGQGNSTTNFYISGYSGGWNDWFSMTQAGVAQFGGRLGIGMTPSNVLDAYKSQNQQTVIRILNDNAGNNVSSTFTADNGTSQGVFRQYGNSFGTSGIERANGTLLYAQGAGGLTLGTSLSQPIYYVIGGTEVARIGTDGSFLVGMTGNQGAGVIAASTRVAIGNNGTTGATTPSLYAFQNVGSTSTQEIITVANGVSGGTVSCRILASGNIQNTNNSYGAISDIAFKENITDATPKLAALMNVKIRNFNMKHNIELKQIGVIAQELETVFPNLVEQSEDGVKSVKYSVFVPILIKAVQELTTRLAALENK